MKILTQSLASILLLVILAPNAFATSPPAFEGRKLYVSHCLICHGSDGKGNGPLARKMSINAEDLTSAVRSRSDNTLMKIITGEDREKMTDDSGHGKISNDMPKWKDVFTSDQINALIAYLRFLSTSKHTLTGDPELGMRLYRQYCSICHGKDGDGKGVMINLIGLKPIDHTNPARTDKMSNEDLSRSIIEGKGRFMPAWRGILSQDEVDGLVSYIRLLYQIWGKLEDGGLVVLLSAKSNSSCGENQKLSDQAKRQAMRIGKQFKSQGITIDKVISSPECFSKETAHTAFGKVEAVDHLASLSDLPESQATAYTEALEQRISSYSGKGNLVIVTHESNINAISFEKLSDQYFLVMAPLGASGYEEIGKYKLDN
ncbi:MAG: c-type cytochrome [Candidatus Thiodiazotropha sp. (ex Monitilora ramsayi)]|nr:c-type cytochrome [Candidatus Thiodiazotropha sp. (ex Monitilora ramsayi)]